MNDGDVPPSPQLQALRSIGIRRDDDHEIAARCAATPTPELEPEPPPVIPLVTLGQRAAARTVEDAALRRAAIKRESLNMLRQVHDMVERGEVAGLALAFSFYDDNGGGFGRLRPTLSDRYGDLVAACAVLQQDLIDAAGEMG